jgi:hypothetical protein
VGELEGLQAIGETTLFRVKGREVSPSFARSSLVGTYRCEVIAGAGVERGRASEVVSSRAAWLAACCLAFLLATVGKGSSRGIRRGGGAACGVDSLAGSHPYSRPQRPPFPTAMDDLFINIAPSKPSNAGAKSKGEKVKGGRWTDRCVPFCASRTSHAHPPLHPSRPESADLSRAPLGSRPTRT